MNPRQRQMIKEAYQAGYQEALDEGFGKLLAKAGKFLKKLFRGGGDDVTSTFRNLQDQLIDQIIGSQLFLHKKY